MSKHVAVLMGGWSAEREVSLNSGANCAKALERAGFTVTAIDVQRDIGKLMAALDPAPDVVFNALHGRFGEDGCIQGLLDIRGIPYTHSGLLASALAMDKVMATRLFESVGIRCAPGFASPRADCRPLVPQRRGCLVPTLSLYSFPRGPEAGTCRARASRVFPAPLGAGP